MNPKIATQRGNLENGLDGIEQYLGLSTGRAAFINEFYFPSSYFPDLAEPRDWVMGDTSACLAPVVMAGRNAALLTLSCPRSLVEYFADIGLVAEDANIMSVCNPENITTRLFPEGAIITNLSQNISNMAGPLQGRTIIPSFVSPEAELCTSMLGGKVLLSPQSSIDFNSKSYLRKIGGEEGFLMPNGLVIPPEETLDSGIARFKQMAAQNNLSITPAWLKLPSVAGGGTRPLPNGPDADIIGWEVSNFMNAARGSYTSPPIANDMRTYNDIPLSMRRDLVLEFDIAAGGETKILGNYCFQAIIGEEGSTYVGTTGQVTKDGDYVGGYTLTQDEKDMIETVLPDVFKVYEAFQQRGYRGVMGVDALVTEQQGKIKPYILEANCRMNGSTPLLALVQKLEATKGYNMYGETVTIPVPVNDGVPDVMMQNIFGYFNNAGLLYQKDKERGLIPLTPDVYQGRPDGAISQTRCAIVGRTYNDVQIVKSTLETLKLG